MKTAILYTRVACKTTETIDKDCSIVKQEKQLRKYCRDHNIQVIDVVKEFSSGLTFNRQEFKRMLKTFKNVENRPDLLLFTEWNKFSRDVIEADIIIRELVKFKILPEAINSPLVLFKKYKYYEDCSIIYSC